MGELIKAAGDMPVETDITSGDTGSAEINKEQLVSWNPDIIFVDHATSSQEVIDESLYGDPDYATLTAVQNKSAYAVPVGTFYWDAGIQIILMVEWMAQKMYPEYFTDLDMTTEL